MILNVLNRVWQAVERDFPVAPLHNELNNVAVNGGGLNRSDSAILTEEEEPEIPAYLYTQKTKTYQALATKLYSQLNPSAGLIANLSTVVDVLDPHSRIDADLKTNLNAPFRKWLDVLQQDMKKNPQNCLLDLLAESMSDLLAISFDDFEKMKDSTEIPPSNEHIDLDSPIKRTHSNGDESTKDSSRTDTTTDNNDATTTTTTTASESAADTAASESVESVVKSGAGESANESVVSSDPTAEQKVSELGEAQTSASTQPSESNAAAEKVPISLLQPELDGGLPNETRELRSSESSDEYEDKLSRFQKKVGHKMQFLITHLLPAFMDSMATFVTDRKEELLYELIEKYITCKIYRKVQVADKISDYKFYERISTLQFVTTKNLDITIPIDISLISTCGDLLTNMNFYKSPRCKLKIIAICCLHIFSYLESCYQTRDITADDFVPVLTYVILKSNPQSLISNINYINDFRCEKLLLGSWGYFFTSIAMSIHFINQLNPELMTPTTPDGKLQEDWVLSPVSSSSELRRSRKSIGAMPIPLSPRLREAEGLASPVDHHAHEDSHGHREEKERQESGREEVQLVDVSHTFLERYKYWNAGPSDIAQNDISELLAEYKRLAMFEYNTLKKRKSVGQ